MEETTHHPFEQNPVKAYKDETDLYLEKHEPKGFYEDSNSEYVFTGRFWNKCEPNPVFESLDQEYAKEALKVHQEFKGLELFEEMEDHPFADIPKDEREPYMQKLLKDMGEE